MGASSHTTNLNLPIYSNPAADTFDLTEWNNANNAIETAYNEMNTATGKIGSGTLNTTATDIIGAINEHETDLADKQTQITSNTNKTKKLVNFDSFGLLTDSTNDQSDIIQSIINYAQANSIHLKFPKGTYRVNKSILIDGTIDIDFSWSEIRPIGTVDGFTNGFVFLIKSTDGVTRTGSMWRYGLLEKFIFNNTANIQGMKGVFVACPYHIRRMHCYDFVNGIVIAGYYIDSLELNDMYFNSINNTDYSIKQNPAVDYTSGFGSPCGDKWKIYNLETTSDTSKVNKLIYLQGFNQNVNISNIINGTIELKNVNAVLDSIYIEAGGLIVENARVKVKNSILYFENVGYPVYLKTTTQGESKQVEFDNVLFSNPTWRDYPNNFTYNDKNFLIDEDFKSNIVLRNCKRGMSRGINALHGCTVKLNNKSTGAYDAQWLLSYFQMSSQTLIFNAKRILNNNKLTLTTPATNNYTLEYINTSTLSDFPYFDYSTNPATGVLGMQFKGSTATYYFRPVLYQDYTRKIGYVCSEQSVAVDSALRKVPVIRLDSNYNYINHRLHFLVGTTSGTYTKQILLGVVDNESGYYYDGAVVNGQQIYSTSLTAPTLNSYSSVEVNFDTGNVTCIGTALPTVGTWSVGDVVYVNGTKYTCTASGTPGTWA